MSFREKQYIWQSVEKFSKYLDFLDRIQIARVFLWFSSEFGRVFVWKLVQRRFWHESFLWVSSNFGRGFVWKRTQPQINSIFDTVALPKFGRGLCGNAEISRFSVWS